MTVPILFSRPSTNWQITIYFQFVSIPNNFAEGFQEEFISSWLKTLLQFNSCHQTVIQKGHKFKLFKFCQQFMSIPFPHIPINSSYIESFDQCDVK